jgi:hypothetical protein
MRNLLAFIAVIVISFSTACYYRGWCYIESLPADPGRTAFRVEIDRLRIARDVMDGARAIQRALATEQREAEKAAEGDKTQPSRP